MSTVWALSAPDWGRLGGGLRIRRTGLLLGREGRAIDGVRRMERVEGASPLEGRLVGR